MSNDVKLTWFYARSTRLVDIAIPDEDWEEGDEIHMVKLNISLFGICDVVMNLTNKTTKKIMQIYCGMLGS